jgi:hypothetical protein
VNSRDPAANGDWQYFPPSPREGIPIARSTVLGVQDLPAIVGTGETAVPTHAVPEIVFPKGQQFTQAPLAGLLQLLDPVIGFPEQLNPLAQVFVHEVIEVGIFVGAIVGTLVGTEVGSIGTLQPLHVKVQSPFRWLIPVVPFSQKHVPKSVAKHCSFAQALFAEQTAVQMQFLSLVSVENSEAAQLNEIALLQPELDTRPCFPQP